MRLQSIGCVIEPSFSAIQIGFRKAIPLQEPISAPVASPGQVPIATALAQLNWPGPTAEGLELLAIQRPGMLRRYLMSGHLDSVELSRAIPSTSKIADQLLALSILQALSGHERPVVREAVADALGNLGSLPGVESLLQELVADPSEAVRSAAKDALFLLNE